MIKKLVHCNICDRGLLVNAPSDVRKNYGNCEMLKLSAISAILFVFSFPCLGRHTMPRRDTFHHVTESLDKDASPTEHWKFLGKFVGKFVLTEFDIEKKWKE